jgi:hypothetical protein
LVAVEPFVEMRWVGLGEELEEGFGLVGGED